MAAHDMGVVEACQPKHLAESLHRITGLVSNGRLAV